MSQLQRHAVAADIVFDGSIAHADWAVVIGGARIAWLGPRQQLPADMPVQNLPSGHWLAPGFIDVQVNGGGDVLFNGEPTPAGIARIVAAHRRYGTTGLLPTLVSDTQDKMRAALEVVQRVP